MTEDELKAIEARANAATPGPWTIEKPRVDGEGWATGVVIAATFAGQGIFSKSGRPARVKPTGRVYREARGGQYPANDQTFIAHSREDIPSLLAEVRRMQAFVQRMQWLATDLRHSQAEDMSKPQRAALVFAAELIERELFRAREGQTNA